MKRMINKLLASRCVAVVLGIILSIPIVSLAQDYFTASGIPVQRSAISSAEFRTEFSNIETNISDKLPAYTGNADEWVRVNAGGTALTSLTDAATVTALGIPSLTGAATITGLWTFENQLDIDNGNSLRIYDSTDTDFADFSHDGTDFNLAFTTTTDWNITGITALSAGTVDADFDAITGTSYGGITEENLVDKTATEGISGAWSFDTPLSVRSVGNTDTELRRLELTYQSGTLRGLVGYASSGTLNFENRIHGGNVVISSEDSVGTNRTVLIGDPDAITTLRGDTNLVLEVAAGATALVATANGETDLYYNNIKRLSTALSGIGEIRSDTSTDSEGRAMRWLHQDGTIRGIVGYNGNTDVFSIDQVIHGADIELTAEDAGGAVRIVLTADPDDLTTLRADTDIIFQTGAGNEGLRLVESGIDTLQVVNANVALTADVGSAQGNGVITSSYNVYSVVGTAGDAATLPSNFAVGMLVLVKNDDSTESMDVFPASGDDAGAGTNTAVAVAAGDFAHFMATAASATWTKIAGGTP